MWMLNLAWKNLYRNRTRTLIAVAAVSFAVILSIVTSGLREGIFNQLVDNITRSYSGKIQLHAAGYWEEPSLDKTFRQDVTLESNLYNNLNIQIILPRLEVFMLAASDKSTKGVQVVGMDPHREDQMTGIRSRVVSGTYLDSGRNGLLVAEGLLRRLETSVGDTLVLLGQGYQGLLAAGKYPIQGSVHFGSPELNEHLVFMDLKESQHLLCAEDRLTAYVLDPSLAPKLSEQADSMRRMLGSAFEALTWTEMMPDIDQHIRTDTRNTRIVQWILYALVSFGIFGTFLMLMSERMQEFGMLLALGMHRIQLASVLVWESLFVFGIGVIGGIIVSFPLLWWLNKKPIRLKGNISAAYERFGFEAVFPASIRPSILLEQALTVLLLGLMLSGYLSFRVFRINPIKAMQ